MKKLLGLLGTIMITGNAIPSVIAAAPNRKHNIKKRQNNENISTTPKTQDDQNYELSTTSDNKVDIIEKEITLNENYSDNIQKMLQELIKNNQLDPLRMINNEGIVRTDYFETQDKRNEREYNIKIIEKLEKILELRKFDADKIRILVLTLKNKDNNEIKLIINLDNFYLQGFINKNNQYFYFKEEKSLNEWKQEIKKLTEELNEWNKINEEIKLLDLKKINNNQHIINNIDEIKENLKKQWGGKKYKENKEKIDLLNKNLFYKIQINNENSESISKLNELKEKIDLLNKEKIYLGKIQEELNAYQKIQKIRQTSINLLNKGKLKSEIKKEYEENIKKYEWDNVFNKITSIIESNINTIEHKKIKENKINEEIIKKYLTNKSKKNKLNYNGSYQDKGLNTVNQNIDINKKNLNNAIKNLSFLDNESNQNQTTKDDLAKVIFITSEAIRFGSYLKYFNYEKYGKPVEFKNIQKDIQNIINSTNDDKIQWKDYSEQLIGGWIASSKYVEEERKKIFKELDYQISFFEIINDFWNNKKFIEKYNFKFYYNEEFETKIEEIFKTFRPKINEINERNNGFEKIGLDKLLLIELEKYNKYINDNKIEKVIEEINQKKEFKNKIQKKEKEISNKFKDLTEAKINQKIKEDISSEIKKILDIKKIDEIVENEIYEILINKDKLNETINFFKKEINKLGLEKEKEDYIINNFFLNIKKEIMKCDILKIIKNKENFTKNINKPLITNKSFDFFQRENFNKIIDKNFLISIVSSNNIDILRLILLKNINVNIAIDELSPLNSAITSYNLEVVKLLLANGANPNLKNKNDYTSLHFAAEKDCSLEIVEELINNGADIDTPNKNGETPLYIAVDEGNLAIVELLIDNGADVNKMDYFKKTPLSIAIFQSKNTDIVKLLLANGADINVKEIHGVFSLYVAKKEKNEKIKDFLEKFKKWKEKTKKDLELLKDSSEKLTPKQKQTLENKIEKRFEETEKELRELLAETFVSVLSIFIENRNLGEISNNMAETILKAFIEKNKKIKELGILSKQLYVTNIKNNDDINYSAIINSPAPNIYTGIVPVTFTLAKKETSVSETHSGASNRGNQDDNGSGSTNGNNNPRNPNANSGNTDGGNEKTITQEKYKEQGARPKGSRIISNQSPKNNNSNNSLDKKSGGSNTQQQKPNKKKQNNQYDVIGDGSCLFWAVATAYLLPTINNNEAFKNRFIQLFGVLQVNYLWYIQNLLQQFNATNHNSTQAWYQDATANRLVRFVLRNRVVDYIQSNLDAIPTSNGELTFMNLIPTESNYINIDDYLEQMRRPNPNPYAIQNSWGGTPEIYAMSDILNCNINVTTNDILELQTNIQNTNNTINLFHVNDRTHYNFGLSNQTPQTDTEYKKSTRVGCLNEEDNDIENNSLFLNKSQLKKDEYHFIDQKTEQNSLKNDENLNIYLIKNENKVINKYNSLSIKQKQQKLNEINSHYQNLSENDKKVFKNKLMVIGTSAIGTGISVVGTKITVGGLASTTIGAEATGEAIEMTPLLSEGGLTVAETLSVAEGTAFVATEGTVISTEAGAAAALAPETLGLSLVIGGLAIAGTAIIWWLSGHDNTQIAKHESHNQYNEIEKYYKFLAHDQLKLDININEWDKIKQIYQEDSNNYQEFKNKIKSEITNFHKEDHSGWGRSITDDDINTLINILYNHFQEINNHFLSSPNHGWKIITNTVGSYFIIEEE